METDTMRGWVALLLACLSLAGCAPGGTGGGGAACGLKLAGDAPLVVQQSKALVDVAAAGNHVLFLLDTGSTQTLLRRTTAERLKLAYVDGGAIQGFGPGGPAVGQVALLSGASVGGLALPELKIPVPPDKEVGVISGDVGGILGMDVMARYETDLDIPNRRVRFFTGEPCPGDTLGFQGATANIRAGWVGAAQNRNRLDPRVYLSGTMDGHAVMALLDSGSQRTLLFQDMAASLGVTRDETAKDPTILLRGIGVTQVRVPRHRIAELRFGAAVLRDQEVLVAPRGYSDDNAMILGMDYLEAHRVWLAPARQAALVAGP